MINVILAFMIIGSFLVAVIIHEYGHALVATMLGDPTPRADPSAWVGADPSNPTPGNCAVGQMVVPYW